MNCYICYGGEYTDYSNINDYILVRCSTCGFVYAKNPPTTRFSNKFYSWFDYKDQEYTQRRITQDAIRSLNKINRIAKRKGDLLDIGCGRGYLLNVARNMGWRVFGIDFSKAVVDFAKTNFNLKVKVSDIYSYNTNKKFDLIILNQVIEHLVNPHEVINKCEKMLRKNGLLYIATPNIKSLSSLVLKNEFEHLIPPEHLGYYEIRSLRRLLFEHRLKIIYGGSWGYSENLAGIIKKIVVNRKLSIHKLNGNQANNITVTEKISSIKRLKIILFDKILCHIFYRLLNIGYLGINLEVIARK